MIIFQSVLLTPSTVNIGQTFLLSVSLYELVIPDERLIHCGAFICGQDFAF